MVCWDFSTSFSELHEPLILYPVFHGMQAGFYRQFLRKLAKLHAEPCMRPGHPAFTESLLVVSCEVTQYLQCVARSTNVTISNDDIAASELSLPVRAHTRLNEHFDWKYFRDHA